MKKVLYKEEGVASAVGTIFAILIFVTVLGIVITTYVPATMTSYEEQYSEGILNSMVQLTSDISFLISNYKPQTTLLVPFDLTSSYVPLFSTATVGIINVTPPTVPNSEGSLTINYSSPGLIYNYTVGGAIGVYTNNKYFVDEEYVYAFSSLIYNQVGSGGKVGSVMTSQLLSLNTPLIGSSNNQTVTNLTITLVNIVGGPLVISSGNPVTISVEILARNIQSLNLEPYSPIFFKASTGEGLQNYLYSYLNETASTYGMLGIYKNGKIGLEPTSEAFLTIQVVTILISQSQF